MKKLIVIFFINIFSLIVEAISAQLIMVVLTGAMKRATKNTLSAF